LVPVLIGVSGRVRTALGEKTYCWVQSFFSNLRGHNDAVRGRGHFDQVMAFLANARQTGLEKNAMLARAPRPDTGWW
jgi:hypothetical protein